MVTSLALHWLLSIVLNITFHSFRQVQKANIFKIGFGFTMTWASWLSSFAVSFMLLLLFLPLFSFAGHLLTFISVGEVFGKVSYFLISENLWWPVMHCPAPSLPSHSKFPLQLQVISQGKVMHSYLDNRHLDVTMHTVVWLYNLLKSYVTSCTGFVQSLEFLKKSLEISPAIFQT